MFGLPVFYIFQSVLEFDQYVILNYRSLSPFNKVQMAEKIGSEFYLYPVIEASAYLSDLVVLIIAAIKRDFQGDRWSFVAVHPYCEDT